MTVAKADAPTITRLAWSIKEVALALGTNYWTVSRAIKRGAIASFQIGGVGEYRIHVFEVARLIGVPAAQLDELLSDINRRSA